MTTKEERIEELQEKMNEFILNHADIGQRSVSWGELAELQVVAESEWDETDEGKELKALLDETSTKVIFRKSYDRINKKWEIVAVFPDMAGDMNPYRTCAGYVHMCQHTTLSLEWYILNTKPATPEEYADLWVELIRIGYLNLKPAK